MGTSPLERELKRGSTELLILALLEHKSRHGYEIGRLIEERSEGAISFHIASLYPTLDRFEDQGLSRRVARLGSRASSRLGAQHAWIRSSCSSPPSSTSP
jgi:DNA-binding PadR family transcriptional regulator